MKNNLLILACMCPAFTYGMETISLLGMTTNSLSMICNETKINLIKGSWEEATDTIELTVVGNHQQHMLQESYDNLATIGHTYYSPYSGYHSIHKRKKDDETSSDDDTYKPHPHQVDKQTWRDSSKIKKPIITIEEPCISYSTRPKSLGFYPPNSSSMQTIRIPAEFKNDFVYSVHRAVPNEQDTYWDLVFIGDEAIQEASKDLTLCYNNALTKGINCLQNYAKKDKNLAFPTLGADVGFPREKAAPIAIATVLEFVQDHPQDTEKFEYESINFFVKKRSDFALYKKLLMEYYKPIKAICLLYCAHKDQNNLSILSTIPLDVINYIARLTINT